MKRIVEKLAYGEMIRYISKCDTCPHFTKNVHGVASCLKFRNTMLISILEKHIINLNGDVEYSIPDWCHLEDHNYSDNYFKSNFISNTYSASKYNTNDYYDVPKDTKCSYCNEDDDSVDRKKNYGMCKKCLENSKIDNTILTKAKLSNFKLKRINKTKKSSAFSYNYDDGYGLF